MSYLSDIPQAVLARAAKIKLLALDVDGGDIVVIGDTPADIQCGRGIGARAIAVATGTYSVDQLSEHRPAAVFEDLSETSAVIAAILDVSGSR